MVAEFAALASGAALAPGEVRGRPCAVAWRLDAPSAAVEFDAECVACVRESCAGLAGGEMRSGAGEWVFFFFFFGGVGLGREGWFAGVYGAGGSVSGRGFFFGG